jgi:hypothetical protein
MEYFLYRDGKQLGPFTVNEIAAGLAEGKYSQSDHVWHEGLNQSKMLCEAFQPQGSPPLAAPRSTNKSGIFRKVGQAFREFVQPSGTGDLSQPDHARHEALDQSSQRPAAAPEVARRQPRSEPGIPTNIMHMIRAFAQREYPDDYAMQRDVVEEQSESFSAIQLFSAPDVPSGVFATIRERAVAEYPDDYAMQKSIIEEQLEAYRHLHSG